MKIVGDDFIRYLKLVKKRTKAQEYKVRLHQNPVKLNKKTQ